MKSIVLLAVLLVFTACSTSPSSVPGHAEEHHHLRFENGYVRVMETRLEPGEETLYHSHPIDAAVVYLTPGQFRISNDDGTVTESTVESGEVAFGAAPIVHRAANIGNETTRVVVTEIFSQPPGVVPSVAFPDAGKIVLDNDTVRMTRLAIAANETVVLRDAPSLVVVAMNRGTVETGGKRSRIDCGGVVWCDTGSLVLRGGEGVAFEAVIVMLKPRAIGANGT